MKKFDFIKTIQLALTIIIACTGLIVILGDEELYHMIAANSHVKILAFLMWFLLGISFLFLLYDFNSYSELRRENMELDHAVYSDALTGIANRYSVDVYIRKFMNHPLPEDIGCCTVEITNLNVINEKYGHDGGDAAIQEFSEVLQKASQGVCFIGRNGGTIRVKRGLYKAICVNSDSRDHEIHDVEDFGDFCISTCDALSVDGLNTFGISTRSLPKARGTEDERMALAPEMVWSDFIGTIDLTDRSQKIILYPKPQVYTCNVEIRNATNLKWIKGLSGSLSTMAGGHHPSRDTASEECVTIPFSCNYNKEDSIITGSLTTFGHCPTEDRTHFLTIYAILADNSRWSYTFDVTDHVHKSEGMNDIHIILDGLPLPKPVVNGGGFKPVLDDWKEVLIDITM